MNRLIAMYSGVACAIWACAFSMPVHAEDGGTYALDVRIVDLAGGKSAPAGAKFVILDTDPASGKHKIKFVEEKGSIEGRATSQEITPETVVNNYTEYVVDKAVLDKHYHLATGIEHGALVIPFKFRIADKSFTGQSSLGYYVGYASDECRINAVCFAQTRSTLLISAGLTQVSFFDPNTNKESQASGLTFAIGDMFHTRGGLSFGLLLGWDYVNGNSVPGWERYQGAPWFSISLGMPLGGPDADANANK